MVVLIKNGKEWNYDNKSNLHKVNEDFLKFFWGENDIEWKRDALNKIAGSFRSKTNIIRFFESIQRANTNDKLNELMSNLFLVSEDLSTFNPSIKKYNRFY